MKRCLLLIFLFMTSHQLPAKQRITGTQILIDPPAEFEPAAQFNGYLMRSTGASIMVTTMDGAPFEQVSAGFTEQGLSSRGMRLISQEKVMLGEHPGVLLEVTQPSRDTLFQKWMLAFGDDSATILVVASYPQQFADTLSPQLRASVLSSEWNQTLQLDFFDSLPFRLDEAGDLKLAKKVGSNVFLTQSGVFPQPDNRAPFVVVGASASEDWTPPGSARDYAHARLEKTEILKDIAVQDEKPLTIDGLNSYLISATGTDVDSGALTYIEQCLIYTPDGYFIYQAMVAEEQRDRYQRAFTEILLSIRTADPGTH